MATDGVVVDDHLVGRVADEERPPGGGSAAVVLSRRGPRSVVERFHLDAVAAGGPHRQGCGDPATCSPWTQRRQRLLQLDAELSSGEAVQDEVDGVVDVHQQETDGPHEDVDRPRVSVPRVDTGAETVDCKRRGEHEPRH